jgi:plastocyanin
MEPNTPNTTPEPASSMNKNWIIGIVVVVIIVLGWFVFGSGSKQAVAPTTENQTQTQSQTPATVPVTPSQKTSTTPAKGNPAVQEINPNPTATNPQTLSVTFTGGSFSPNPLTIKKGYIVKFVNKGESSMWVASDPHPTHTGYPGFDEKVAVGSEGSYSFTFNKVGTFGYHNHLNPMQKGVIIVQP